MAKNFDVNAVVSSIINDYAPNPELAELARNWLKFEELKAELAKHEYADLKHWVINDPNETSEQRRDATAWYKIKHILIDTVIVEDVLLRAGKTRFDTYVIKLSDWDTVFGEWIDRDHDRWWDCDSEYREGMRVWGAHC